MIAKHEVSAAETLLGTEYLYIHTACVFSYGAVIAGKGLQNLG